MNRSSKNIAIGTAIAGAMGYLAGILTAPKSGRETRTTIRDARDKRTAQAEKQLKSLHTELSNLLGQAGETAKDVKENKLTKHKAAEVQSDVVEKAGHARQKAREILSALHDGGADDKDLDKAMAEASKAVKALRSYLKK